MQPVASILRKYRNTCAELTLPRFIPCAMQLATNKQEQILFLLFVHQPRLYKTSHFGISRPPIILHVLVKKTPKPQMLLGLSLNERSRRRQRIRKKNEAVKRAAVGVSPESALVFVAMCLTDITHPEDKSCNCGVEQPCTEDCQVHFCYQAGHPTVKELPCRNIVKIHFPNGEFLFHE